MEVGQPYARKREFVQMGGRDFAAERANVGVAEIVGDDVENVRRIPTLP